MEEMLMKNIEKERADESGEEHFNKWIPALLPKLHLQAALEK